ncbi:MAG: TatD family hydrolase [Phycisphaerales bacterium]|nr:TatD family hydrolase [Phycisphaerales bacterium]
MFDTHCHLTFDAYEPAKRPGGVEGVLADAKAAGVDGCITISTTSVSCLEALALAEEFENVWCSSGVHPLHSDEGPHDWEAIVRVARHPKCVAWGELGLDNHYTEPAKALQRAVLDEQLSVIIEHQGEIDKPIVVHCREAFDELIPILEDTGIPGERFVFHCFTGGPREMEQVLAFGAWASFTGVLTYRNAKEVREAAKMLGMERVMVETDAPFLTPEPNRGKWPNEPGHVVQVARTLAEVHGVSYAEMERVLDGNAGRFFGIGI